jgi:hypothetical protein
MKNIHVLPTDKPSRLHLDDKLFLSTNYQLSKGINSIVKGRNIYITSDEEIKEGDWCYFKEDNSITKTKTKLYVMLANSFKTDKKIILTTDQDLIKDGVQDINDEFLKWFVNNPSCEVVEVVKTAPIRPFGSLYKIIIPKEEPKQETKS